jgi:hypothetical protein
MASAVLGSKAGSCWEVGPLLDGRLVSQGGGHVDSSIQRVTMLWKSSSDHLDVIVILTGQIKSTQEKSLGFGAFRALGGFQSVQELCLRAPSGGLAQH